METLSWRAHLRALVLVIVGASMFLLGTPGLDGLDEDTLKSAAEQTIARQTYPGAVVDLAEAFIAVHASTRLPLVRALTPIQRPFRIEQSWSLYGDGPDRVRRLEIWLDGVLKYRSADPDHDWLAPVLRYRRLRPVVDTMSGKPETPNAEGLCRLVLAAARRDFPEVQRVVLRFTDAPFPTGPVGPEDPASRSSDLAPELSRFELHAPDWKTKLIRSRTRR